MTKEEIEERYGLVVKNNYTIGNWRRAAARQNLSLEEYLQSLSDNHKEIEACIKQHQDLCVKYGIEYINEVQFARFIEAAKRNNMSLDEWVASVAEAQRPKVQENHHQEWVAFMSSVPDLVVVDLQGPNDLRPRPSCKEWVCDVCGSHYIAGVTDGLVRGENQITFHVCFLHIFY